ncbi:MAG: TIGR03617 family F420-dependent LLM class oxidoreductase [Rhodospirillales bacterium]|nr:TIGR03617 family F420-dependent LLM class oxidoreductase [Rhodospirillales bacterium]
MKVMTRVPLDDWNASAAAAKRTEELGFHGLTSFEIDHDPFIPLAFAAMATNKINLATAIAVAFPRSPMITATTAWDLQRQSGGRFSLGIGSQVKGHNVRRFSVPWSAPVPRLREYIQSLRTIWECWERGDHKLQFEGEHYNFSLTTPEFSPDPTGLPMVPISISAVGPAMLKLAGEVCDGVKLHLFCSRKYLEEVCLPQVEKGLAKNLVARENFEIWGGGFVATGQDEQAVRTAMDEVRYRIAFYGSTRSYRPVLSLHGLDDLGDELHHMSVSGGWKNMASLISDDVVELFGAVGTYDTIVSAIEKRYGGLSDVINLDFPENTDPGLVKGLLQDIDRIPTRFQNFKTQAAA